MSLHRLIGLGCLMLAACDDKPDIRPMRPAQHVLAIDDSGSFGIRTNAMLRERVARKMRAEMLASDMQLGDKVKLYFIGRRRTELVLPQIMLLDRQHRPLAVANEVYRRIMAMGDHPEQAQNESNILFLLSNGGFDCGPDGRGALIAATDLLVEEPEFSDWRSLVSGKAQLPAPLGTPLKGCRARIFGAGLTGEGQRQLTSQEIATLSSAVRSWLLAAGASDVSISSGF
ncbi:hypothetical protein J3E64_001156 [Sphingobium sp. OAS761]|uniref:hypothetical protein n=1 Tax=Sphingobium sp. OAS761 TaxID=2817901 RepID=UPI00209ECC38|nr:hypothetical protein [Sphingobium sp. OAS761]MCP1469481.1 hypothetical protein [Sphingobium sp. OAS761]